MIFVRSLQQDLENLLLPSGTNIRPESGALTTCKMLQVRTAVPGIYTG
jgi:hypothetical protein